MWKTLVVGGAVGYLLALSTVPRDLLGVFAQLPQTQNKAAVAIVAACIFAAYVALIFLPLSYCASQERASYEEIPPGHASSFRANLKRRGSLGHLEFLQPTLRHHLLASVSVGMRDSRVVLDETGAGAAAAGNDHVSAPADPGSSMVGSAVAAGRGAEVVAGRGADVAAGRVGEVATSGGEVPLSPPRRRPRRARIYSNEAPLG